jgi:endonuclease G
MRLGKAGRGIDLDVGAPDEALDELERMVMPWHDEDYSSRMGYDPKFIGANIPMPEPADPSVVARTKDGADVLHYQNFSIVTHATRRMALFTASNVTAEPDLRKPEARHVYTRKGLSGLGPRDQERWFPDPRLSEDCQLPDVFYSRSGFDRGHVVRRDDVAWGRSYDEVRRANGDTFHLANCSPQVPDFNRSSLREDNWGNLENHVLKSATSERYCQFSGPLFHDKDEVFLGRGGGRTWLKVKIPSR